MFHKEQRMRRLLIVLAILSVASAASAGPIAFTSGAGDTIIMAPGLSLYASPGPGTMPGTLLGPVVPGAYPTQVINPHPDWFDVGYGAEWVSFAQTGYPLGVWGAANPMLVVNPNVPIGQRTLANATGVITETFNAQGNTHLRFKAGADDTMAWVLETVGGSFVAGYAAVQGQQDPCAPGNDGPPIGCVGALSMGNFLIGLPDMGGDYRLTMYLYQTNNWTFGATYAGELIPEPGSMMLLGSGLIGLAGALRRRIKK
jgi:hypothetical protein